MTGLKLLNYQQQAIQMEILITNRQLVIFQAFSYHILYDIPSFQDKSWGYENVNSVQFSNSDADDAPLNLSLKSTSEPKSSTSNENILDLMKNLGKSSDSAVSVNNLSNLQSLTAGIGLNSGDSKGKQKQYFGCVNLKLTVFKDNSKKEDQETWDEVYRSLRRTPLHPCLRRAEQLELNLSNFSMPIVISKRFDKLLLTQTM